MHRFLIASGCALLLLVHPADAASKPKPPAMSAGYQTLCLYNLHWRSPDSGISLSAIEGVLVNSANVTLSNVSLGFALTSGRNLVTTASASFSFAPIDSDERKQWEKIHGKRQR